MNVLNRLRASFAAVTPEGGDPSAFAAAVRPAGDPKFGDYQANGCMAVAKAQKKNPREVAAAVAEAVDLQPLAAKPEVAGPGFLNVRLHDEWLAAQLAVLLRDPAQGLVAPEAEARKTVVIDFSSPNVAKPMHVGHLRSTVIGDSLARIFEALGHKVVRDNHLGDWGAQFGMILWAWKNHRDQDAYDADPVAELARLYRLASARIKEGDKDVEVAARAETAKLHAGDPENRELWRRFMPHCLNALRGMYDRLGVRFDVELGESFYDPMLAGVVADLESKGIAEESEGAVVAFVEGIKAPFIVRKRDGAFNYGTTDLATIQYREETWNPDQALYVVDARQGDHFKQLFAVARRWGYDGIDLQHVAFGTIMGPDRRPYKTRDGDVVGLESLLDEAVARAREVVDANSPDIDPEDRARVAEIVGLGAVKYADLSQNRVSDYVFDWAKMLAMNGNTATYLQYAYARIQNIFRKGEITPESIRDRAPAIFLSHPAERGLAVRVLRLPEVLELAASELKPNVLTDYLFDLANAYSTFYEECPVLKAESDARRDSRLALGDLTARTLKLGLDLLGINVVDRM
jgi:arginyl-tRNA synthetase